MYYYTTFSCLLQTPTFVFCEALIHHAILWKGVREDGDS